MSARGAGVRAPARPERRTPRPAPPRRTVLGLPARTAAVVGVVLVLVLLAAAWFSPLLVVRGVTVRGTTVLDPQQVVSALDVPDGTRLLPLDTDAAGRRVSAALPRVATVEVSRSLPSGLVVTVTERTAVAWTTVEGAQHLVDAKGVDFATQAPAPGIPEVVTTDGPSSDAGRAALQVLLALPPALREQVAQVSAQTPDAVSLRLGDGRSVVWGSPEDTPRKAAVLTALLTQPGTTYDVSSPDLPTTS